MLELFGDIGFIVMDCENTYIQFMKRENGLYLNFKMPHGNRTK